MSLDATQLRQMVIKPALEKLGLWSTAAEELVLGTAIVESSLVYIRQHGAGPALGLWQVEPTTHDDLHANYLSYRQELSSRLMDLQSPALSMDENLATNLMYDTAVCRLCYYRQPEALPEAGDIDRGPGGLLEAAPQYAARRRHGEQVYEPAIFGACWLRR